MAKPAAAGGAAAAPEKKGKKKTFKKKERKHVPHGLVYVQASFNNTIVTITDMNGNVLSWKSSGSLGFRGSRKGTPFAAQQAAQNAANAARDHVGGADMLAVTAVDRHSVAKLGIWHVSDINHSDVHGDDADNRRERAAHQHAAAISE